MADWLQRKTGRLVRRLAMLSRSAGILMQYQPLVLRVFGRGFPNFMTPRIDLKPANAPNALRSVVDHVVHRVDNLGVELRPGVPLQFFERDGRPHGQPVRAIADHRVERIGDRDDARGERDLRRRQPIGIAAAVEALVMSANRRRVMGEQGNGGDDGAAVFGMSAHDVHFRVAQTPRCLENFRRSRYLSDVVNETAARDVDRLGNG